ncbi:Na+/H+ antiporter subunit E [Oceanicoccus sp. KOV_DT_Chl]|uniref:Na+/H+ antiporter subunit E n=1 Tax=Oceanicoccus sp. KOV_DT_Chl TaxID=1904639 RepID=UPI000C7A6E18|nr:Na+/H+ antiporter subunit E [Oceanicoccus sp. KOV_DT_Chl]
MHITKWAILLSIFWLLLSGMIEPLLLSFGAVSVAVVLLILKRMDEVDQERQQIGTGLRLIRYLPWLIVQIIRSSVQVTKLIWSSSGSVSPSLAIINVKNIPLSSRTLYANSITLTPGTLSVDLVGDELTVHALQKSSIDELERGKMEKKITAIWKEND